MSVPVDAGLDARLAAALLPFDAPLPEGRWNHDQLSDLLDPARPLVAASVLVGLVARIDAVQVLLTRRTEGLRHHAGQVSFPGGRIEPDDAGPVAAAVRECGEETGIGPGHLRPVGLLEPMVTITGFRVVPVVAWIDPAYVARPDPREVAEIFEVPLPLLLDPAQVEHRAIEFNGRVRHVPEYRYAPQRIWGASAMILGNLRERLEAVP